MSIATLAPAVRRTLPDGGDLAVDAHRLTSDELGGDRSADVGEEGDHSVEALPVEGGGHLFGDHVARSEVSRSSAAPTTMAASARLNTGHH